jgi:hypothetical protein
MENRESDDVGVGGLPDGWDSRRIPLVDRATALAANSRAAPIIRTDRRACSPVTVRTAREIAGARIVRPCCVEL